MRAGHFQGFPRETLTARLSNDARVEALVVTLLRTVLCAAAPAASPLRVGGHVARLALTEADVVQWVCARRAMLCGNA